MPVHALDPLGPITSVAGAEFAHDFVTTWSAPERNTRMQRCMAMMGRGWRGLITDEHAFRREELAKDPFHNEFILHHRYSSFAGAIVAQTPEVTLPISVERRIDQGSFSRGEVERMNRLFVRLRPAAGIAVRLGLQASTQVTDIFERLGQPAALLGHGGMLVRMNARFDGHVGDGVLLRNGHLGAESAAAETALSGAIHRAVHDAAACEDAMTPVVLPRRNGRRPLLAQVSPVVGMASDAFLLARAVVLLTDLEKAPPPPHAATIQRVFGLTPAEARLAGRIAAGESLNECADAEGITRETARSRIKAIFEKTGTRRQTELALLIARTGHGRI
jgi:DNA-binding CsgD family transcriptional regulator